MFNIKANNNLGGSFTFDIKDNIKATLYISHDSDFKGAANYFYQMLHNENLFGTLADRFFRANPYATIAVKHDTGDNPFYKETHYVYELTIESTVLFLKAWKVDWTIDSLVPDLVMEYNARLDQFINKYLELPDTEKVINDRTTPNISKEFNHHLSQFLNFTKHGQINNAQLALNAAKRLAALLKLPQDQMNDLNKAQVWIDMRDSFPNHDFTLLVSIPLLLEVFME